MKTKLELGLAIASAAIALAEAKEALAEFESLAENNVFETIEKAVSAIENKLECQAHEDCEGSYNCGDESYSQEFIVDGVKYVGTLTLEYNRHDKTYYYIDGSEFTYEVAL